MVVVVGNLCNFDVVYRRVALFVAVGLHVEMLALSKYMLCWMIMVEEGWWKSGI